MKNKMLITAGLFTAFFLISCSKNADSRDSSGSITGKWKVITDSSYQGVGLNNHLVVYKGHPGDYFDFNANGNLYVSESNIRDTFSYHFTSGTDFTVTLLGTTINAFPGTCHITHVSTNNSIITTGLFLTPGGAFGRTVVLKR